MLPDADTELLLTVLPHLTHPGPGEQRTAGQRRADALIEVFDLARRHTATPTSSTDTGTGDTSGTGDNTGSGCGSGRGSSGARVHIDVVVGADWLTNTTRTVLDGPALLAASGPANPGHTPNGQAADLHPIVTGGGRTAPTTAPPTPGPQPPPGPQSAPGSPPVSPPGGVFGPVWCAASP